MSTHLIIYIWGILDDVKELFLFFAFMPIVVIIFHGLYLGMQYESLKNFRKKLALLGAIISFLSGIAFILTPSSKTFAAMVIIPEIVESKAVQKDLPELYDMAVDRLKESLKK